MQTPGRRVCGRRGYVAVTAALAYVAVASFANPAAADQRPPEATVANPAAADRGPPEASVWYGWQTLLVDGGVAVAAGTGALLASTSLEPTISARGFGTGLLVVAGLGYALGAPIVHFAHGRSGTGLASLALRIVAPLLAVLPAVACMGSCGWAVVVVGGVFGGGGIALDASALSWERES